MATRISGTLSVITTKTLIRISHNKTTSNNLPALVSWPKMIWYSFFLIIQILPPWQPTTAAQDKNKNSRTIKILHWASIAITIKKGNGKMIRRCKAKQNTIFYEVNHYFFATLL